MTNISLLNYDLPASCRAHICRACVCERVYVWLCANVILGKVHPKV